jgi:hypothetical protein
LLSPNISVQVPIPVPQISQNWEPHSVTSSENNLVSVPNSKPVPNSDPNKVLGFTN